MVDWQHISLESYRKICHDSFEHQGSLSLVGQDKYLGKIVLSTNFGVGKVVGLDTLGGKGEYLVVESMDHNVKNFLPVAGENNFRLLLEEDDLIKRLDAIGEDTSALEFESKKDRINYFKNTSKTQKFDVIIELINQLILVEDRGALENQILDKLSDTIALEHSITKKLDLEQSKKFINDLIQGDNR
ncbi:hypothetical protein N9N67_07640 [Bacteriovoracaceae bacterium]|nr:hypothetical protein [Bacteriovoracaceae bacterium]